MADEKTANFEETKWWIDRGPVKERDKSAEPIKGIIEKWAYELLKNYNQDQAAKNLVDINSKILNGMSVGPGEYGYYSLDVGTYPPEKLAKSHTPLAPSAKHAGYGDRWGLFRASDHHRRAGRGTLRRYQFYRRA